jgi:hypothetical protein
MSAHIGLFYTFSVDSVDEELTKLRSLFGDNGCEVTIMIVNDNNVKDCTSKLRSSDRYFDFLVYMGHELSGRTKDLDEFAEAIVLARTRCLVLSSCNGVRFKRCLQTQDYQGFVVFFKGKIYGDLAMELDVAFCRQVIADVNDYKTKDYRNAFNIVSLMYANMIHTGDWAQQFSDGTIGFCCADQGTNHQTVELPNAPQEHRMLSA